MPLDFTKRLSIPRFNAIIHFAFPPSQSFDLEIPREIIMSKIFQNYKSFTSHLYKNLKIINILNNKNVKIYHFDGFENMHNLSHTTYMFDCAIIKLILNKLILLSILHFKN